VVVVVVVAVTEWETVDVIVEMTGATALGRRGLGLALGLGVVVCVLVTSDVVVDDAEVVVAARVEVVGDLLPPPQPASVMAAAIAISAPRFIGGL
jgi:hypothetical protein